MLDVASKVQTLTTLCTTELKYMALSMAIHEQLPLLELLREVMANKVDATFQPAAIHCKSFEDKSRVVEMAKLPEIHLRTKNLNNDYHHFWNMCKQEMYKLWP